MNARFGTAHQVEHRLRRNVLYDKVGLAANQTSYGYFVPYVPICPGGKTIGTLAYSFNEATVVASLVKQIAYH